MSSVSGPGGVPPDQMKIYKEQFNESVSIFKQSLSGYSQSSGPQQAEYKKAMDESLQIMDQLGPLFNKEIQKQKAQLEADYQQYTSHQSSEGLNKVQTDVDHLEGEIK